MDSPRPHAGALRFGNVELRPLQRLLLVGGQPAALGARAFDVLLALAELPGRLVGKSELIDLVWPGVVVEENNLQVQVSALRKLLGAQAIATIPGRGYRFTLAADGAGAPADAQTPPPAPAAAAAPPRGNLVEPPPLVGRAADEQAAAALIAPRALVTLVGAGGIGKTRLAQALAWQHRERWPDGVWWVDLAALGDAARVLPTVAAVLGVNLPDGTAVGVNELAQRIALLSALVVLDNCEHVIDAVSALAQALHDRAPGVALLATSQELLRTSAERVHRLQPLALPPAGANDDPRAYGAVALFEQRVRAVQPPFVLGPAHYDAAVEVCRRLDGLPLAIELAAARVPLLGLEGLRQSLGARFRVLTGGARLALRKHQTLRAALEWSVGLLDDDERAVLRRLGVFAGGFTLELAQLVAADAQRDGWAVLDLLAHLVDKSLVVASAGPADSVPRYSLLESTRAFALEQLAAAGEAEALLRRHAQVMRDFAQTIGRRRWTLGNEQARVALREMDNLRAALDWALGEGGDRVLAIDLLAGSAILWYRGGLLDEGLQRLLALRPLPPDLGARREADFCLAIARLSSEIGQREEYWQAALRAESLYRQLGDDDALADALLPLAIFAQWRGDAAFAERALAEAARLIGADAPLMKRAALALVEGALARLRGDYAQALAAFRRQEALYLQGGTQGEWIARGNIGMVLLADGQVDEAVEVLRAAVEGQRQVGTSVNVWALSAWAAALAARGDDEALARSLEAYRQQRARSGRFEWAIDAAAMHHARHGDARRALLLGGWASRQRADGNWAVWPHALDWGRQLRALAAAALPAPQVDAWFERGQRLSDGEVAALAYEDAPLPAD
jgi:predicted ATPase/DNA-binding winged helix-turn-helix (wHTH) protein